LKKGTNTERYLLPHGKAAVAGDVIHQPELGQDLCGPSPKTAATRSTRRDREDMVETLCGIGGLDAADDFRPTTHRDHGADRHHVKKGHDVCNVRRTARASPCW